MQVECGLDSMLSSKMFLLPPVTWKDDPRLGSKTARYLHVRHLALLPVLLSSWLRNYHYYRYIFNSDGIITSTFVVVRSRSIDLKIRKIIGKIESELRVSFNTAYSVLYCTEPVSTTYYSL